MPRTTKSSATTTTKPARPARRPARAGVQTDEEPLDGQPGPQEEAEGEESEGAEREDSAGGRRRARRGSRGRHRPRSSTRRTRRPRACPTPTCKRLAPIERFDALAAYLREVQSHPLLSPEETHALAVKFVETQDSATAARLVTANLRLVVKIAYEYRRAYKNIMDLIQEGNIGLMQAVKRYDPYRGVKLSSYAAWWIRAYILRFILNNWRLVKLGTTQAQRKLFFNLRKKRAELQAMGVDPTNAEIAKQLNVPESDVAEMEVRLQAERKVARRTDGRRRRPSRSAKIDTMPSSVEGPETIMADSELQGLLKEKLSSFARRSWARTRTWPSSTSAWCPTSRSRLQELGDRFGISRERVRQLEQRLTGRLRDYLRDEMGDAVESLTRRPRPMSSAPAALRRRHADRQPRRRDGPRGRDAARLRPRRGRGHAPHAPAAVSPGHCRQARGPPRRARRPRRLERVVE